MKIKTYMRRKLWTCIFFLIISDVFAQNYKEVWGFRIKQGNPDLDGYSIGHAAEGACVYFCGKAVGLKPIASLGFSVVYAFGRELYFDGKQNKLLGCDPDPDGADLKGDPFWDMLGAGLAFIGDLVYQNSKYKFVVRKNGINFYIKL